MVDNNPRAQIPSNVFSRMLGISGENKRKPKVTDLRPVNSALHLALVERATLFKMLGRGTWRTGADHKFDKTALMAQIEVVDKKIYQLM